MVDVSVIIINYNTSDQLLGCLKSVPAYIKDITVVDNGSTDGSPENAQKSYPGINIIRNETNLGFARAVNQGLQATEGTYKLILNSDVILTAEALPKLTAFLDNHPDTGIVTGQLMDTDGSQQNSFDNIPTLFTEALGKSIPRRLSPAGYPSKKQTYTQPIEVESIIGAAMLVRQKAVDETGLMDEDYFLFLEETDWCLRIRQKGWKVFFVPDAGIYHLQGQSKRKVLVRAKAEYLASLYKFFRKHHSFLSYALLRIIKPIKIMFGLCLNLTLCLLTLCLVERIRDKVKVYSWLALWHLLLCPPWMGLRKD